MPAPLAQCLSEAALDAGPVGLAMAGDPLRLDIPPDAVDDDTLEPRTAAVLGSLYLLSELEAAGVVACAELLASQRWSLGLRDASAARGLEAFAAGMARRLDGRSRGLLYLRLFGAVPAGGPSGEMGSPGPAVTAGPNHTFEELLAGYCQALVAVRERGSRNTAAALRMAGGRLRRNLAPPQYGNTLLVAGGLVAQMREALDLLAMPGIGALVGTSGAWEVVRALQPDQQPDIGRYVDRGRTGRMVVASVGHPHVPDVVDTSLAEAAGLWLAATGFTATTSGAG